MSKLSADLFIHRDAEFAFEGAARLVVMRIWDDRLPLAGWARPEAQLAREGHHAEA